MGASVFKARLRERAHCQTRICFSSGQSHAQLARSARKEPRQGPSPPSNNRHKIGGVSYRGPNPYRPQHSRCRGPRVLQFPSIFLMKKGRNHFPHHQELPRLAEIELPLYLGALKMGLAFNIAVVAPQLNHGSSKKCDHRVSDWLKPSGRSESK